MATAQQTVGSIDEALQSIVKVIEVLDPGAAPILMLVEGVLKIAPEAIQGVEDLIKKLKTPTTTPLEPQIASDTAAAVKELEGPLPPAGT